MTDRALNDRSADVSAISAIFGSLANSWNSGDGMAYGEHFTVDADYIDITGAHTNGRAAIARSHQFLFDGPLKGSTLEPAAVVEVNFLSPEIAVVVGGGTSRLAGQDAAPADRASINTTVLIKRDGVWQIRAFQNTRVQPRPSGPPAQGKDKG
jgi:uncharacterized protein (TIGR02246 family)